MSGPLEVRLSLISHTNVGKTTLARTLLRRDIGEVRDAAHVTEVAESHTLIETPQGEALVLWDTPGFGDSARLLRRLEQSGNPLGWFLTQVWDRYTDRPFWSSQQAMRNVRDHADVVLYLANAAEDPASAGYVDPEMRILGWIGKPVVVLLNQLGPPRPAEGDAADVDAWGRHLALARGRPRRPRLRRVCALLGAGEHPARTRRSRARGRAGGDVQAARRGLAGSQQRGIREVDRRTLRDSLPVRRSIASPRRPAAPPRRRGRYSVSSPAVRPAIPRSIGQ